MKERIDQMKRYVLAALGALFCLGSTADAQDQKPTTTQTAKVVQTDSGLRYTDEQLGTGAEAVKGKEVSVHYTGWLNKGKDEKGTKFDSSRDRGQPFSFPLGAGMVIQGWEQGVQGMKVGGKRTLLIPAKLGYGTRGAPPVIPPNSDLIFDVELLGVK